MSGRAKEAELPVRQSFLAAKELAAQLRTFVDGDDIEEHLRRLDDLAELMMVDETVKYQAILLSMDEPTRMEFNAWLKAENLREQVKGKPEELKKRLLEKFRVRKSLLERINFIVQPRRQGHRLVLDLLERKRVYDDVYAEVTKFRDKLFVEAALQLLSPGDRADYCNLHPDETKRVIDDVIEFARRKEEERLRERKVAAVVKKNREQAVLGPAKKKKDEDDDATEDEDEEKERMIAEGRCFICKKIGHVAAMCPRNRSKAPKATKKEDEETSTGKGQPTADGKHRGSGALSF